MHYKILDSSNKEEWISQRTSRVTATDLKKIKSGTVKAFDKLWREKRGKKTFSGNKYTKWGNEREPIIAAKLQEFCPEYAFQPNDQLLLSAEEPRFAATPDMLGPEYIAELKTCLVKNIAGHDCTAWDVYLGKYADQVQWQLLVTGAKSCVFVVEFYTEEEDGFVHHFRDWCVVKPDLAHMEKLKKVAYDFLEYEPSDIEDVEDFEVTFIVSSIKELDDDLASLRSKQKEVSDKRESLVKQLLELRGAETSSFKTGGLLVDIKGGSISNRFDRKSLAKEYPEIEQKFVVQTATKPRVSVSMLEG